VHIKILFNCYMLNILLVLVLWYVRLWVCSCTILRCRHAITAPHLSITPRHDMLKCHKPAGNSRRLERDWCCEAGIEGTMPLLWDSSCEWRKDEARPLIRVSALFSLQWLWHSWSGGRKDMCPVKNHIPLIHISSFQNRWKSRIQGGTWWPRFTWKNSC